jgi:uncharacterized repeat protein (TIGR01451 family)
MLVVGVALSPPVAGADAATRAVASGGLTTLPTSLTRTVTSAPVVQHAVVTTPGAVHDGVLLAGTAITATGVSFSAIENSDTGTITVATFTDSTPSAASGYSVSVDWGDGTTDAGVTVVDDGSGNFHVAAAHTYAEDGSYTVTTTITETGGDLDQASALGTATVGEGTLSISSNPISTTEGTTFNGTLATFSDPGSPDLGNSFTAVIDWGDGSSTTGGTFTSTGGGGFTVSGAHDYADEGSYTVSVQAFESNEPSFNLEVSNTAKVNEADTFTGTGTSFNVTPGTSFSGAVATFADPYPGAVASDLTAAIDWGDATVSAGVISGPPGGPFVVSGVHTYASSGAFTVTTTLADDAPGTASGIATSTATVALPPVIAAAFSPDQVALNGTTSLDISITNPAANTVGLDGVAFDAVLPAGLTTAASTVSMCGGTLTASLGTTIDLVGATLGVSGTCSFAVPVTATQVGTETVIVGPVTSTNAGTGNTASASVTVSSADLRVGIGASPNPVRTTTNLTYTITVLNSGPTAAPSTVLTDTLAPGTTFVSLKGVSGCSSPKKGQTGSVICSLGTLAAGASVTLTIVTRVNVTAPNTVTNVASVSSAAFDPLPTNNVATVTTSVFGRH